MDTAGKCGAPLQQKSKVNFIYANASLQLTDVRMKNKRTADEVRGADELEVNAQL